MKNIFIILMILISSCSKPFTATKEKVISLEIREENPCGFFLLSLNQENLMWEVTHNRDLVFYSSVYEEARDKYMQALKACDEFELFNGEFYERIQENRFANLKEISNEG